MDTADVGLHAIDRAPALAGREVGRVRSFLVREWLLILLTSVFVASSSIAARSWVTSDSWFDFVYGRDIIRHGLPHSTTLTVLGHGHAWVDQQWLGQVVFYWLFAFGGAKLVALFSVLLFSAALVLAVWLARRRGASALAIGGIALLAWLYLTTWIQTEAFSHLFFVCLLGLLAAESRKRTRRVLLAFPLLAVWANLHGAVVLGAALVALLGAVELMQRLRTKEIGRPSLARALLLILTPWLFIFATPYGFSVASYYRGTIFNSAFHQYLGPWMPPTPFSLVGGPFFCLALVATALVARRWHRLTAFELVVLAVTLIGAVEAERSIMWFALAAVVLLPALLERDADRRWREPSPRLRVIVTVGASLLALVTVTQSAAKPNSYYTRQFPEAAGTIIAREITAHPGARVFGTDQFGDWLVYTRPELWGKVGYDADWEQLTQDQVREVIFFLRQSGVDWERPALGFRLLVISPKQQPWLIETYDRRSDIRVLYRGPDAVVFERT